MHTIIPLMPAEGFILAKPTGRNYSAGMKFRILICWLMLCGALHATTLFEHRVDNPTLTGSGNFADLTNKSELLMQLGAQPALGGTLTNVALSGSFSIATYNSYSEDNLHSWFEFRPGGSVPYFYWEMSRDSTYLDGGMYADAGDVDFWAGDDTGYAEYDLSQWGLNLYAHDTHHNIPFVIRWTGVGANVSLTGSDGQLLVNGAPLSGGPAWLDTAGAGYNGSTSFSLDSTGFNDQSTQVGFDAYAADHGASVGINAAGNDYGAAVGYFTNGAGGAAAMGYYANGSDAGAAIGYQSDGSNWGAALGFSAAGLNSGAAVGGGAYGPQGGVAIGAYTSVDVGQSGRDQSGNVAIGGSTNAPGAQIASGLNDTVMLGRGEATAPGLWYGNSGVAFQICDSAGNPAGAFANALPNQMAFDSNGDGGYYITSDGGGNETLEGINFLNIYSGATPHLSGNGTQINFFGGNAYVDNSGYGWFQYGVNTANVSNYTESYFQSFFDNGVGDMGYQSFAGGAITIGYSAQNNAWINYDGSAMFAYTLMNGPIYFGGSQDIQRGTFDNGTGGNNGISLMCAIGYELNWQGGHLTNFALNAVQPIIFDSPILLAPNSYLLAGNDSAAFNIRDDSIYTSDYKLQLFEDGDTYIQVQHIGGLSNANLIDFTDPYGTGQPDLPNGFTANNNHVYLGGYNSNGVATGLSISNYCSNVFCSDNVGISSYGHNDVQLVIFAVNDGTLNPLAFGVAAYPDSGEVVFGASYIGVRPAGVRMQGSWYLDDDSGSTFGYNINAICFDNSGDIFYGNGDQFSDAAGNIYLGGSGQFFTQSGKTIISSTTDFAGQSITFNKSATSANSDCDIRVSDLSTLFPHPYKGQMTVVIDAASPAYNTAVVGNGSDTIPVIFDGTTWKCH